MQIYTNLMFWGGRKCSFVNNLHANMQIISRGATKTPSVLFKTSKNMIRMRPCV